MTSAPSITRQHMRHSRWRRERRTSRLKCVRSTLGLRKWRVIEDKWWIVRVMEMMGYPYSICMSGRDWRMWVWDFCVRKWVGIWDSLLWCIQDVFSCFVGEHIIRSMLFFSGWCNLTLITGTGWLTSSHKTTLSFYITLDLVPLRLLQRRRKIRCPSPILRLRRFSCRHLQKTNWHGHLWLSLQRFTKIKRKYLQGISTAEEGNIGIWIQTKLWGIE